MSSTIASELTRIIADRDTIRTKTTAWGLTGAAADLDAVATAIGGIAGPYAPAAEVQEGQTYTITPGYYTGGTVTGIAGGGSYTLQAKGGDTGILPTAQLQTITADSGYYGLSSVKIAPIPSNYKDTSNTNAVAADILSNKIVVTGAGQVVGTMVNNGAVDVTLDCTTGNQEYNVPVGYHNGNGYVSIITETKTATPTTSSQTINATTGKVIKSFTVNPIPSNYKDSTGTDAVAANVLAGKVFVNTTGQVTGTMVNRGALNASFDALNATSYTTSNTGYYSSITVSLTNDLLEALEAI